MELEAEGYQVRTAADGEEGLRMALERCPDLVLADVMMPRMDGFELVRRLRADPRTEGVSIILLTARGLSADKLEGLTAGADDYIVKPFESESSGSGSGGPSAAPGTSRSAPRSPGSRGTSGSRRRSRR